MSQEPEFSLGEKVRDTISGFTGIVTRVGDHISGCTRIEVNPTDVAHDAKGDSEFFYEAQLELVEGDTVFTDEVAVSFGDSEFQVGQIVRDEVTGFEGIIGIINYPLFNCPKAFIQDQEDPNEGHWFDSVRIEAVSSAPEFDFDVPSDDDEQHTQSTGACASDAPSERLHDRADSTDDNSADSHIRL